MKPWALCAENVYVAYNNNIVIANLSLAVPQGVLVAIVGPNGAGKTTLLQTIIGFLKPVSGVITCLGLSFAEYRKHCAYIPQRMHVDWEFPIHVQDVVLMGCYQRLGMVRRPRKCDIERAQELLDYVGMSAYAHTPIAQLSGGQQQRVFLARALMQDATLFFFDEPFTGIDVPTEQKIIAIFHELRSQGKTIFVVHHNIASLYNTFDWVVLMNSTTIAAGPTATTLTHNNIITAFTHGLQASL